MTRKQKQLDYDMAAECLKVMAHPGRLQLIRILIDARYCVGDLAQMTDMPANTCSEHLRLLQRCGLLAAEREGRTVYYSIAEPLLVHLMSCIESKFTV